MKLFKYKSEEKLKKQKDIRQDLLKKSVLENGIVDIDEKNYLLPQNDKKYAIYKIEFLISNGIDVQIDNENEERVNEVLKALEHDFKIVDMPIKKDNLNKNIDNMLSILENNEVSKKRLEKIAERIEIMQFYNAEKYLTTFLLISQNDVEIFEKLAPNVFAIERLEKMDCIEILKRLNNGF